MMRRAARGARRRAQRLPPEERHRRLLVCALEVFARLGVGSTVHADVAREAAVSVPTVFTYFPTREILTTAVLAEVERFLLQLMAESVTGEPSSAARIGAILRAFAHAVDDHADYIRVWMDWSTIVAEPTWSRYIAFQDRILANFEELIAQGQATEEIDRGVDAIMGAHLIMGSGHMIAQMKFRHRDDGMIEHFIDTVIGRALFDAAGATR